jgi:hypothetical protein
VHPPESIEKQGSWSEMNCMAWLACNGCLVNWRMICFTDSQCKLTGLWRITTIKMLSAIV